LWVLRGVSTQGEMYVGAASKIRNLPLTIFSIETPRFCAVR